MEVFDVREAIDDVNFWYFIFYTVHPFFFNSLKYQTQAIISLNKRMMLLMFYQEHHFFDKTFSSNKNKQFDSTYTLTMQ